jgi:hypothetical protein
LAVHLPKDLYAEWLEQGKVRVYAGRLGKTKTGNVKLFAEKEANTDEKMSCGDADENRLPREQFPHRRP